VTRAAAVAAAGAVAIAAIAVAAWALTASGRREPVRATLTLAAALGDGDTTGYARALEPRPFAFPHDHGPHPEFRTEWWYFTGNLEAEDGAPLGYELTFFRSAIAPATAASPRASAWAADHIYMAHLAVTDARGRRFHAFDRFARAAVGLAGARAEPFRVWTEDWRAESAGAATFPLRLIAAEGDVALDLVLAQGKPPVSNGERGLSRKGPERGNASYYYSLTRMPTEGTVRAGGATRRVRGASWMDREWSTSGLGPELAGWDWFALQLSDTTELMVYRLRGHDGGASPFSGGTFVDAAGAARTLAASDVVVDVLDTWRSPRDGARYPARWRLRVPAAAIDVEVTPLLADQELNLAVRYWEGTARVDGRRAGRPVAGRAYVELTGYAEGDDFTRAAPPARRPAR
jgi:predicted secreted hydrolase